MVGFLLVSEARNRVALQDAKIVGAHLVFEPRTRSRAQLFLSKKLTTREKSPGNQAQTLGFREDGRQPPTWWDAFGCWILVFGEFPEHFQESIMGDPKNGSFPWGFPFKPPNKGYPQQTSRSF